MTFNIWNNYIDNAGKIDRKESCLREYLYIHFWTDGHIELINEVPVAFIDKAYGKDPKNILIILISDTNIENNGTLWSQYCSWFILHYTCLLTIIFSPLLFFYFPIFRAF